MERKGAESGIKERGKRVEGRETRSDFVTGTAAEASEVDRSADLIRDQMIMVFVTSLSINQMNKTTVHFLFKTLLCQGFVLYCSFKEI